MSGQSTVESLYRLLPANAVCSRAVCGVVTALVLLYNLCVWWNIYELLALVFIKLIMNSSPNPPQSRPVSVGIFIFPHCLFGPISGSRDHCVVKPPVDRIPIPVL